MLKKYCCLRGMNYEVIFNHTRIDDFINIFYGLQATIILHNNQYTFYKLYQLMKSAPQNC